jgi:hypothetical protein
MAAVTRQSKRKSPSTATRMVKKAVLKRNKQSLSQGTPLLLLHFLSLDLVIVPQNSWPFPLLRNGPFEWSLKEYAFQNSDEVMQLWNQVRNYEDGHRQLCTAALSTLVHTDLVLLIVEYIPSPAHTLSQTRFSDEEKKNWITRWKQHKDSLSCFVDVCMSLEPVRMETSQYSLDYIYTFIDRNTFEDLLGVIISLALTNRERLEPGEFLELGSYLLCFFF